MNTSLERVRVFITNLFANASVALTVPLVWESPSSATAAADSGVPEGQNFNARLYAWSSVRDRLINTAEGNNEPSSEVLVYSSLPLQQVPYVWEATDNPNAPRHTSSCLLTFAQAQQLGFNPAGPLGNEIRVRARPEVGVTNPIKWQFYKGKVKDGHTRFDEVMVHEVFHLLGFGSSGDTSAVPNWVSLLDCYRFAESAFPVGLTLLDTGSRELRPNTPAAVTTRTFSTLGAGGGGYLMSRGTRAGGDGGQASHFRRQSLIVPVPPLPVGVMDPGTEVAANQLAGSVTRADLEVLDVLGWPLSPVTANLQIAADIHPDPVLPAPGALVRSRPTFEWTDATTNSEFYSINLFTSDPITEPDGPEPMVLDNLIGFSAVLPVGVVLPPGTYTWELVGRLSSLGAYPSAYQSFTVACPSDFNLDGNTDPDDLADFINCFFQIPPCPESDINGDGETNPDDLGDFVNAYFNPC